jgi:hypothetical protein
MENQNDQIVKTGDWILTLFLCAIPIVGFVMLFVWAFGGGTNPSKVNWAKAMLIWIAICVVIGIFFFTVFSALFIGLLNRG